MIRIPQHSGFGNLNDLQTFQEDLEGIQRKVDYWMVEMEEFTGHGSLAFEELTLGGAKLSSKAFSSLCYCVDQTIDGVFTAFIDNRQVRKLDAVDSRYWEITGSKEFENSMLEKYGNYDS